MPYPRDRSFFSLASETSASETPEGHVSAGKGRRRSSSMGKMTRSASSAATIASAVKIPKWIVGMKSDNTKIENPIVMLELV